MKTIIRTALAAFFVVFFPHFASAQDGDCMTIKQADTLIDDGFMSIEASRQKDGYLQFLVKLANGKFVEFTLFPPETVCITREFVGDPRDPGAAL
jgi:hypothetical protein